MSENYKTAWLDSKGRVIYRSAKGALFTKNATGKKIYGVKPHKPANKPAATIKNLNMALLSRVLKNLNHKNTMSLAKALVNPNLRKEAAVKTIARYFAQFRRKITFMFRVMIDYPIDNMTDANRVARWFESLNRDLIEPEEITSFTVRPQLVTIPKKKGSVFSNKTEYCMVGTFRFNPIWAHDLITRHRLARETRSTIEQLIEPDDDGNHPITFEGQNYLVSGYSPKILSIE
jgi:hypothetical protein